jgi:NAD(P)-dependent dehydrogenase (short-subunit alcohol dehydrogenase family)
MCVRACARARVRVSVSVCVHVCICVCTWVCVHSLLLSTQVVSEIKAAGGVAVADYNSVEHGDAIVATAIKAFGRIDIVINNAGILRDITFLKMTPEQWCVRSLRRTVPLTALSCC